MRILYGIQGTGNGHLSRGRVMAPALAKAGIEVDYFFSGRPKEKFFDMDPFGEFECRKGLSFATRRGKVNLISTVSQNDLLQFWRDVKSLDLSQYDLILNDFEPISAWAAKRQDKTCIGISHQNAFNHRVPVTGDSWVNRLIMKCFAPTTIALGCHWHHFGCDLLPPFVETLQPAPLDSDKILVYLPFEEAADIVALLATVDSARFEVYHGSEPPQELPHHICWNGFSRDGFQADLASCNGVICSAGFELVSESLVLGKKILLKPLKGQFEQLSNALALELLGAAETMDKMAPERVRTWLKSPGIDPIGYPESSEILVEWLLERRWDEVSALCRRIWSKADLPETWDNKSIYSY